MGKIKALLAFTRIPGNALSFWIRQSLHWSKGKPKLYQEAKEELFSYLGPSRGTAEKQAEDFKNRYALQNLAELSTAALYRKNLYLLETLEKAAKGLELPDCGSASSSQTRTLRALDVGSQDWHYVFALEKWLRFYGAPQGRAVSLQGLELDGYGIYSDFHSRKDYAEAYVEQTENKEVGYTIGDFLKFPEPRPGITTSQRYDFISIFYPFVTRYQLLLWGLPLRFFSPPNFLAKAANLLRPGGWLLVFCHTQMEHDIFMNLGTRIREFKFLKQGPVRSNLVDFHAEIQDRHFSIWKKI